MPPPPSRCEGRIRLVVIALAVAWVVLAGRLVQLQWIDQAILAEQANRQRSSFETIPARPGEIVDRHGRLLATTVTARSLFVVPSRISDPRQVAIPLAEALDLDAHRLADRISERHDRHFLWVKRRLNDQEVEAVRSLKLAAGTWGFRQEYLRRYPQGALAAHVLGLRDIDGRGRGGLEQSFDAVLRGRDGRRVLVRDARGRVIEVRDEAAETPRHGRTVVLTLDVVVQLHAERELDKVMSQWTPRGASVIVLDPRTCEVLAMASRPTFDPNHPAGVPEAAWKNTAIASMFEPGSTFKPFVTAWAMEQGVLDRYETFDCEQGAYRMGRRILHDHHPHGRLSVSEVLVKSSNIGMAKIGERLANEGLYEAAISYGFGSKTGIELPGEVSGLVRPLEKWDSYSTGSVPMGHEIAATPLQLITAHAALANGGKLTAPRLVLQETGVPPMLDGPESPRPSQGRMVSRTVRPDIAKWLVEEPMAGVVSRGTGRRAQLEGYTVFGKTGTAQKVDPASGGYSNGLHVSSFLCGAPVEDPRVLVLVVVDEPSSEHTGFGGEVAAPAAANILRKTLIHLRIPARAKRPRLGTAPPEGV